MATQVNSVVQAQDFHVEFQKPGWESPTPEHFFKGEAMR